MSDIKVKLTEQSIGVPDTGSFIILNSDNAAGDINHGLLVGSFAIVAIVFALAIVAVIKKHRAHSSRCNRFIIRSKAKTALSFSICILLASILVPIASQYFSDNQKIAQAATDTLTISAEPISITAELSSSDTITAVSSNVTVTSATTAGYTLGVYATNKDLVSADESITTKISGLSVDDTEPTILSSNTWGLATTAPMDAHSKVWRAISDSEAAATIIKETSNATPANDTTMVWYGINANDKLEPSEYTGTINYIAVANVAPDLGIDQPNCNPSGATISEIICMQDISSTNRNSILESMAQDEQYQLYDFRDNKQYYVAKLADGNIWMTQNLDHNIGDIEGGTYTPADTDIKENWTPTVAEYTHSVDDTTWTGSRTAAESYDPGDICWDGSIVTELNETIEDHTTTCNNDKHYHIGNYYNWTAAVAGNGLATAYGGLNVEYDMDTSICPAGWTLPKSGHDRDILGSFAYLNKRSSFTAGPDGNIHKTPVYFTYSGYWDGEIHLFAESGEYWLGTSNGNGRAWFIDLGALHGGRIGPNDSDITIYGRMLRCLVLNPESEPTSEEPDPELPEEPAPEAPDPELPEEPELVFDNVEWTKYGDVRYNGCSEDEPAAGEHVVFPDSTSIRLIGSTGSAVSLGAYYDKIATNKAFSFQVDIDASSIGTHPTEYGAFTISLGVVDEDGRSLLRGIEASIASTAQTISIDGTSEEIALASKNFTLLFTYQDGEFRACATEPGKERQCISATMQIPVYAYLKIDFNLSHGGHCCSQNAQVELHDIDMRSGSNAITF